MEDVTILLSRGLIYMSLTLRSQHVISGITSFWPAHVVVYCTHTIFILLTITTLRRRINSWWIRFLSNTSIEIEILLERYQPIGGMVSSIDRGHRMLAHLDLYGIAAMQDATIPSIKGDTGISTRIVGNVKAQYDGVRKDHAAKT